MLDLASPRVRAGALALLGVSAAVLAFVLVDRDDRPSADTPAPAASPASPAPPAAPAIAARAVTQEELKAEASAQDHPVYWAGPRSGVRYELSRAPNGNTFVRYLTGGAPVGDAKPRFLAVATYPESGGFDAILAEAAKAGNVRIDLPAGGVAVSTPSRPSSVYLSYPGADYQVEVFAPAPGKAEQLVRQGRVRPLGGGTPVATGAAVALDQPALRAAATKVPFYWAGPRGGASYELTQTPEGRVFVRYLTGGAKAGDRRAKFLTIATYPSPDAIAGLKSISRKKGIVTLDLEGGGIAVLDPRAPTSVYVAYPGTAYQVEVYSPKPGEARALVERGKITRAG